MDKSPVQTLVTSLAIVTMCKLNYELGYANIDVVIVGVGPRVVLIILTEVANKVEPQMHPPPAKLDQLRPMRMGPFRFGARCTKV